MTTDLETYAAEVIAAVCERHGITSKHMLAMKTHGGVRYKDRKTARAREDAARLFRATVSVGQLVRRQGVWDEFTPLSYPRIGNLLGGLNHATVIKAEERGARCKRCGGRGAIVLAGGPSMGRTTSACIPCDGTGKLPPLTWDAYMENAEL